MYRLVSSVFLFGGVCAVAQAQSVEELEARFEEAQRLYKVLKFKEALAIYEELYLKSGSPELLYNIGQCYRQLGDYEKALKSYNTFLRELPDTEIRPQVEDLIAEVTAKMAVVKPDPATQPTTVPVPTTTPTENPALIPAKKAPSAVPYFAAAGGVGVLWAVSGLLALRAAGETQTLLEDPNLTEEGLNDQKKRTRNIGLISDVSFLGALALGGAGVVVKMKSARAEVSANGLSFAMEF